MSSEFLKYFEEQPDSLRILSISVVLLQWSRSSTDNSLQCWAIFSYSCRYSGTEFDNLSAKWAYSKHLEIKMCYYLAHWIQQPIPKIGIPSFPEFLTNEFVSEEKPYNCLTHVPIKLCENSVSQF